MSYVGQVCEAFTRQALGLLATTLSAALLGQLVWLWLPAEERPLPQVLAAASASRTVALEVPTAALFGRALVVNNEVKPLAETKLQLILKGVVPAEQMENSIAIIASQGGADEIYSVGAEVARGVTLESVYSDRVILQRGSNQEVLYFEKMEVMTLIAEGALPESASVSSGSAVLPGSARDTYQTLSGTTQSRNVRHSEHPLIRDINSMSVKNLINAYEQKLQSDPQGLLTSAGLKSTGQSYQVLPSSPLTGIGLRAGDEILSINGQAVGNIANDRALGGVIRSQGVARIEMRRGERRFFVNYPIQ